MLPVRLRVAASDGPEEDMPSMQVDPVGRSATHRSPAVSAPPRSGDRGGPRSPPGSTPRADGRIRSDPTPRVRICRPRRSRTPERPRPARRVCGPAGRAAADGVRGTARGAPRAPGRPRDRGELALAPSAPRPGGSRPGRGDEALPRCDARLPPWEVGFGLPTGSPAHPKPGAAISPEIIRVRTRTRRNNHPARASHPSRHRHPRHFPGLGVAAPSYGRRSSASRPRRARRRSGSHRTVRRTPPA
jgi:hypothetical protein